MVQEGVQKLEGSFQRLEGSVATVKVRPAYGCLPL